MMTKYLVISKHTFLLKKLQKNEYIKSLLSEYLKKITDAKNRGNIQQHSKYDKK